MFRNTIKITWRNLRKNQVTSLINIGGLALGICCFFLLGTYIINELRYDRFHKNADRIVYLSFGYKAPSDVEFHETKVSPSAVVPTLKHLLPELEDGVRLYKAGGEDQSLSVRYEDKRYNEKQFVYADDSFFKVFSFDFIAGNPEQSLKDPYSIVITASSAKRYFGEREALGESLMIKDQPWKVTGIIRDIPPYSQLQFNILGSYSSLARSKEENWGAANDISFLLLKSADQMAEVQSKIDHFIKERFAEQLAAGYQVKFPIQKLTDVRLHSKVMGGAKAIYIYLLAAMAASLLLIACINFANLIMAKSVERAHEIGVKKVLGALRKHVLVQFIMESFFTAAIALLFGIVAAIVLIPAFNTYTGIPLSLASWGGGWFIGVMLLLFLFIALVSGGGPAWALSAIKPTESLKGKISKSRKGIFIRKGLIVFQFSIALLFIISTVVVSRQMRFLQTKDTGMNRSQVIVLGASGMSNTTLLSFKNALESQANISGVTASYDSPVHIQGGYSLSVDDKPGDFTLSITGVPVEKDFAKVLGIQLLAGENFDEGDVQRVNSTEEQPEYAFILNETALKSLEWTAEESIGKWANVNGRRGRIKGIVEDFNFASLHDEIGPIVMFPEYHYFGKLFVKTASAEKMSQTLGDVQRVWKTFNANKLFDYHFLDEEYNALYTTEERTSKILALFSIATIIVSALGLFALSTLTIQQRIKEIGVRKVLGASIASIAALVSFDFIKLVVLGILISAPIAWWVMTQWLQDFAFRIDMEWWMFALAALMAIGVAFITVSFQAVKAGAANPVESLRNE